MRAPLLAVLALVGCGTAAGGAPDAGLPDAGIPPVVDGGGSDAGAQPADAGQGDAGLSDGGTVIVIHYPTPSGHAITLRGNVAPLNWNTGMAMTPGSNDTWTVTLPAAETGSQPLQLKPLYDDQTWAIGPNYTVPVGAQADLWPHFFNQYGTISEIDNWYSQILDDSRTIWVYLPPSYAENANEVFPVAYFQDGQNLFYADLSASGVAWNLQGAMDQGSQDGTIHEAIIVGIANDANRIWEYTPTNGGYDGGGAAEYLSFVSDELKPQIDMQYRTLPDAADTAICGSSLGALLAAYAGVTEPGTYGLLGVLSPSTWWDNEWVVGAVMGTVGASVQPFRVYVDSGNAGVDDDDVTLTVQLAEAYADAGVDLDYLVQDGGQHSEFYWAQRVPGTMQFLLGPREFTAVP